MFLDLQYPDDLCRDIAKKCQFDKMKKDKHGLENPFWLNIFRDKKNKYYRKGKMMYFIVCKYSYHKHTHVYQF